jgi:hypothetical protein
MYADANGISSAKLAESSGSQWLNSSVVGAAGRSPGR